MICRSRASFAALFGLLVAGPLMAHHSLGSEFQMGTPSAITGVLTRVEWDNPHIYWTVDVKDEVGKVTRWSIECLPPSYLRRSGVTRQSMEALMGATITVHGALHTSQRPVQQASLLMLENELMWLLETTSRRFLGNADQFTFLEGLPTLNNDDTIAHRVG